MDQAIDEICKNNSRLSPKPATFPMTCIDMTTCIASWHERDTSLSHCTQPLYWVSHHTKPLNIAMALVSHRTLIVQLVINFHVQKVGIVFNYWCQVFGALKLQYIFKHARLFLTKGLDISTDFVQQGKSILKANFNRACASEIICNQLQWKCRKIK